MKKKLQKLSKSVLVMACRTTGIRISDFKSKLVGWTTLANCQKVYG